jgi:HEAT repeat protein
MNDLEMLKRIEQLYAAAERGDEGDVAAVTAALKDDDWQVVQAALMAIRRYLRRDCARPIVEVLERQEQLDLYGQTEDIGVGAGVPGSKAADRIAGHDREQIDAWMCRWRVKQAACFALGEIGGECGREAVSDDAVQHLSRLAISEDDDYQVKAAACHALGRIGDPAALPALKQMTEYDEFCARTEARKAVAALEAS